MTIQCVFASLSGTAIELQKILILTKTIIFSDLFRNKQNCSIWGTENPHAYIEKPKHSRRAPVWCGFRSRDLIGLGFFENEHGEAVTVNGDRYRVMLNEFLFRKIEKEDIGNIWLQQDGSTCNTAAVLHPVFEDRIISRRADVVWPPRSCELTSLDYYLWGAVKPEAIDALKDNIREAIGKIQLHIIDNVLKNWTDHVGYSHLN